MRGGGGLRPPKCTNSIANITFSIHFRMGGKTTKRNGVPGEGAKRPSGGREYSLRLKNIFFGVQTHLHVFSYINAVPFYYLWHGAIGPV